MSLLPYNVMTYFIKFNGFSFELAFIVDFTCQDTRKLFLECIERFT